MRLYDSAGKPIIKRPNWTLGRCVVCGEPRTWDDLKPYPHIGGLCDSRACRENFHDRREGSPRGVAP